MRRDQDVRGRFVGLSEVKISDELLLPEPCAKEVEGLGSVTAWKCVKGKLKG